MELHQLFLRQLSNIHLKLIAVLSSCWGWVLGALAFIASYFGADVMNLAYLIWIAVTIDLALGIVSAVKRKKHILSQAITKSIMKFAIYTILFAMIALAEKGIDLEWFLATRLVFAFYMAAEIWSATAHIAVIYPQLIFIRLLRRSLAGEVAKKLGITVDEALELLNGKETNK